MFEGSNHLLTLSPLSFLIISKFHLPSHGGAVGEPPCGDTAPTLGTVRLMPGG